jgi:hypothetical protein
VSDEQLLLTEIRRGVITILRGVVVYLAKRGLAVAYADFLPREEPRPAAHISADIPGDPRLTPALVGAELERARRPDWQRARRPIAPG